MAVHSASGIFLTGNIIESAYKSICMQIRHAQIGKGHSGISIDNGV